MSYCNHCKRQVSPKAKVCPNCGEPNPTKNTGIIAVLFTGFLAALGLVVVALFINGYYFFGLVGIIGFAILYRLFEKITDFFK